MIVDKIATLVRELGLETQVFVGDLPAQVDNCITVFHFDGLEPQEYIGIEYVLSYPIVRVVVRNLNYSKAIEDMLVIRDKFKRYNDEEILGMILTGDISYTGKDEKSRTTFMINFKILTGE